MLLTMKKTAKIYGLFDPKTDELRYIGKTTRSLYDRFYQHYCEKGNYHKNNWIKQLKKRGLKPRIELIEEVDINNWQEYERYYITFFREAGCPLTNHADGGYSSWDNINYVKRPRKIKGTHVVQLTPEGEYLREFNSLSEFSRFHNVRRVSLTPNNPERLYHGYLLIKKEEYNPSKDYKIKNRKSIIGNPIELLDSQGNVLHEYKNRKEASIKLNMTPSEVSTYCRGKLKNNRVRLRYKYLYSDEFNKTENSPSDTNYRIKGKKWMPNNPVLQLDEAGNTIKEFKNRKEASEILGVVPSIISTYCLRQKKQNRFRLRYKY